MDTLTVLDYLSLFFMLFFWLFYDIYAQYQVKKGKKSLMGVSNSLRMHWIYNFSQRPSNTRIADAQLISTLHRGISFFVSITIFIIAGLMTILNSGEAMLSVLSSLPLSVDNAIQTWSIKIICIIFVFVVAFFRLTWALRQNQYYAIAISGAPYTELKNKSDYILIKRIANLMSDSGKNFNNALRSYYFGLSMMAWLIHPILFILCICLVVVVLYRREFHSKTLAMMEDINQSYNNFSDNRKFPK